jgi:hypothetical protein
MSMEFLEYILTLIRLVLLIHEIRRRLLERKPRQNDGLDE